ncbi:MAG: VCBS repeat-containing protein [Opitutaceae bacterium]|nr:VCBS repeat-containing protein [Opitutaceae bacterium]
MSCPSFRRSLAAVIAVLAVLPAAGIEPAGVRQIWHLERFDDFAAGTFDDGGVNAYVAADGSIRLINQWDLNADGWIDILLPNSHGYNEKVDLSIYWGRDGWSPAGRTQLPSDGGKAAAVADLDGNGWPDLVLANRFNGTKSELDLWIYWGGPDGFSAERRSALPAQGAEAVALADLNGDGHPEIIVANSGLSYHVALDSHRRSYVYWNRNGRFAAADRLELPTAHAQGVAVADLDGNGRPDVVFANQGNAAEEAGLTVYFNPGDADFSPENRRHLPGERSSGVAAADLNRDGRVDLVVANAFRLKGREGGIYNLVETTHLNSLVYWNGPDGFDPARRTALPTVGAQAVAAGDLNADGWPDLAFAQAGAGASFIYLGGPDGFQPHRRIALPGQNHSAAAIADLDGDGHNDLLLALRKTPGSFAAEVHVHRGGPGGLQTGPMLTVPAASTGGLVVADPDRDGRRDLVVINRGDGPDAAGSPAYVYPGGPDGFDPARRLELPTRGSDSYLPVDLNADGHVDLFFPHSPPTIFWGGPGGIQPDKTSTLSPDYAFSGRAADFNRDGYLDLVVSEWQPGREVTHIYYGGPGGFTTAHRQPFPIRSVRFHTIADLDRDGWIDVVFPNFIDEEIVIFWNSPLGFSLEHQTRLPVRSAVAVEVADLNADGHLDLIVPNLFDKNPEPGKPRSFGGSPHGDTFIYWGGPAGFHPDRRTVLPSTGSADAVVADLNRNGHLDLVLTNYHEGETRSGPSYIYWNGPEGFHAERHTRIPSHSASGALVADFNRDGRPDLFLANHSKDGNHRTDTWLYWGRPEGFSAAHRTALPGLGPHFLTAVDIGHVYDRGDRYTYTSAAHDAGGEAQLEQLVWEADTPFRTGIRFQVRSADSAAALAQAPWAGPDGPGTHFTRSGEAPRSPAPPARWFQLRAELTSPDSANSPVLKSVTLHHHRRP